MMFDINRGNTNLTIAKRFARENTNDAGDQLNEATANMLILEFKKFMFLCALRLVHDTKGEFKTSVADGETIYMAPFPAPPLIDKVWDMFILYSENYRSFCKEIFNGILDKRNWVS